MPPCLHWQELTEHQVDIGEDVTSGLVDAQHLYAVCAAQELTTSKDQIALLESNSRSLAAELSKSQQQLSRLEGSTAELQEQLDQAAAGSKQMHSQHQQEMHALQNAQEEAEHLHAEQITQLKQDLQAAQDARTYAEATLAELHKEIDQLSDAQLKLPAHSDAEQQHADSLAALQAELAQLHSKLQINEEATASMHIQSDAALSAQAQQYKDRTDSLTDEIASLKQELSSRESTPESTTGDLQQQLDSARTDASKQAKKLAQAEMRASLVRQQLQEAHYQLRQLEERSEQAPQPDDLQESLDSATTDLNMPQGRLSPTDRQVGTRYLHKAQLYALVVCVIIRASHVTVKGYATMHSLYCHAQSAWAVSCRICAICIASCSILVGCAACQLCSCTSPCMYQVKHCSLHHCYPSHCMQ